MVFYAEFTHISQQIVIILVHILFLRKIEVAQNLTNSLKLKLNFFFGFTKSKKNKISLLIFFAEHLKNLHKTPFKLYVHSVKLDKIIDYSRRSDC